MPFTVLKQVYNSLVYSHLLYGIEFYANTYSKNLEPLEILNNKILRILLNCNRKTPNRKLYSMCKTLLIDKLFEFRILLLLHKFKYDGFNMPIAFQNYFKINSCIHNHNTRQSNRIHVEQYNSQYGLGTIKYKGLVCFGMGCQNHLNVFHHLIYLKKIETSDDL